MAKVMVSLPDELLRSIDREAARTGMTRSGLLRTYAADAIGRRCEVRAQRVADLTATATRHGGDGVEQLKALRQRP
jgi:metal-responsive CopG/Arc/MetJ family transcriptional regulator